MNRMDQIVAYRCKKCGRIHYPCHDRCLDCKGRDFDRLVAEGDAKLLTYTQIFNLPWGFEVRFLIIGIVEFENKVKAMGQIHAASLEGIHAGMLLKPAWQPVRQVAGEAVYGLVLYP
ncbi:MAG: hypothetical protein GYA45_09495 [Pelolinea sp.]|jgi:uncharacterized OB-fold protein|nr:hypothetical protein [Pelolinea sp.]